MRKRRSKRIIIDTNLWISFLISKRLDLLERLVFKHDVTLLFSQELLEEIRAAIHKPKLKKHFGTSSISDMLESIEEFSELIVVSSNYNKCRDPKDNFLLSLAKDGQADFLITGDKDLLVLSKFGRVKILTLADYFQDYGTNG